MGESESSQAPIRAIDCMPQLEIDEYMPFLELIKPLMVGNELNRRYQWFLEKFSGISVAHGIGLKYVDWIVDPMDDRLSFIKKIGELVDYYEEGTDDGQLLAHAEFMMPDYFLFDDGVEDPESISLLDIAGFDLFNFGVIMDQERTSVDKDTAIVLKRVLPTGNRIHTRNFKDRLYKGNATCLEYSIIAGMTASLYPFLRTSSPFETYPIVDLQIVGVPGKNVLLGNAQDPLHFGVVILDSSDERWLMLAGVQAYSETEISDAFKECKRQRKNGNQDEELRRNLRAQALGLRMIKKSRLTM